MDIKRQSLEVQNDCAEIKLRCERRMGEMIGETELNKGILKRGNKLPLSTDTTTGIKLSDMGISKDQSSKPIQMKQENNDLIGWFCFWKSQLVNPNQKLVEKINVGNRMPALELKVL